MSNFKCSECGMINIDCGKEGYKTSREIELETLVIELENRLKTLDEEAVTYQLTEKEYEEYKSLKKVSKEILDFLEAFYVDGEQGEGTYVRIEELIIDLKQALQ